LLYCFNKSFRISYPQYALEQNGVDTNWPGEPLFDPKYLRRWDPFCSQHLKPMLTALAAEPFQLILRAKKANNLAGLLIFAGICSESELKASSLT
jgi:hypothetical protein